MLLGTGALAEIVGDEPGTSKTLKDMCQVRFNDPLRVEKTLERAALVPVNEVRPFRE